MSTMTKNEYANFVIDKFCERNNIDRSSVTDWHDFMFASGSLAVCLEYLGMLSYNDMKYSSKRGGFGMIHPETHLVISTRDILKMLPDDDTPEQESFRIQFNNISIDKFIQILEEYKNKGYNFTMDGMLRVDHAQKILSIIELFNQ